MIGFCNCDHSNKKYPRGSGRYWANDVCMYFREKYKDEFKLFRLPSALGRDSLIMVRESTKEKGLSKKEYYHSFWD